MNLIQVFEHKSLVVGEKEFKQQHFDKLAKFHGNKDFPYYSLAKSNGKDAIRFRQYVGVISVGDLQIEVLPKVDNDGKDENTWQKHLMQMLAAVFNLKIKSPSDANLQIRSSRILDIFLEKFLKEVEELIHRGLVKCYHKIDENSSALKGRIVFQKQLTQNVVHKERFYVEHTTYDQNHICNRIIYKALKVIPDITSSNQISGLAKTVMFNFPEVNDIAVDNALFNKIEFSRKTEDYKLAISIARLILLNYSPILDSSSKDNVLALMFDMNDLWEKFVFAYLKRHLSGYTIKAQSTKYFWRKDGSNSGKEIKPDIICTNDDETIILDTKWKCPKTETPDDADLKQIFVYNYYYKKESKITSALVYPEKGCSPRVFKGNYLMSDGKTICDECCNMIFLPIDCAFCDKTCGFRWEDVVTKMDGCEKCSEK